MKVVFHKDFYQVYSGDPAAAAGRMQAIVETIEPHVELVPAKPASRQQIAAVHTEMHIRQIESQGLYEIAALAAGGAVQAAQIGLSEPCFGLIRPPGHHASAASAWGFCCFNNMAVALEALRRQKKVESACVLDVDLHFGDGTVNILGKRNWATVINVDVHRRDQYLREVAGAMKNCRANLIGISAGFDNHTADWGGLLNTEDYEQIGYQVRSAANRNGGGCFAILEGGYNHEVLGENVMALIQGMAMG
ncbi:MAG: histone deacetylase family protein [Deltaproteobacteria bacterium]|jgi:acetoin utilization deacetylase AcuC-like enzyme|nr:histone deacetylase family protein [Deltaproteobacteria bacterium]